MAKRYVLYDPEMGIYLGHCMGLGFWSKLDSVRQDRACTFESVEDMEVWVATWEFTPPNRRAVPVEVAGEDEYATIEECTAAGLPAWQP